MTKKICILFLLLGQILISQTFVDDVDKVENVVITYKVDSNGKRYDVKIDNELTTYQNKGWQEGTLEHFMNGELKYPMRMINAEWRAVYYFINPKYKTSSLDETDIKKCNKFRKGEYRYSNPSYDDVRIIRRKNKQIEKGGYKDERQVYKIEWSDDNKYTLKTLKLQLEKDKEKIGNVINVEIIEILDDNSYLYRSSVLGNDRVVIGVIQKIK